MLSPRRDTHLAHQVVLQTKHNGVSISVTCNCRLRAQLPDMGLVADRIDTRLLYNDPNNHTGPVPFTDEHKIRYKDVEAPW